MWIHMHAWRMKPWGGDWMAGLLLSGSRVVVWGDLFEVDIYVGLRRAATIWSSNDVYETCVFMGTNDTDNNDSLHGN